MRQWLRSNQGFLLFLLLLGFSRTTLADWNHIPSGSMRPNLLEGDVVFVNRIAYHLKLPLTNVIVTHIADPARGEIVTFYSPRDGKRLIKRVVGLPGDTVEMRGKALTINGHSTAYERLGLTPKEEIPVRLVSEKIDQRQHLIQWDSAWGAPDSFGPIVVPPDRFLVLGDNRDHSADSRFFGLVPRHLLIGRAERILVSADIQESHLPRFERFGQALD